MAKSVYITTTLPYVNADPHIGFALELVQADIYARYRRLLGDEVFFNTGTDEHGQKIWQKAQEKGEEVQAYVDHYAERFKSLTKTLNISNDVFIRTTDEKHIQAAQELWKRCEKDIEKRKFKGLYCVGCEAFIKETDLVDGLCPDHQRAPEEVEEENYFFKFSNYQNQLLEYLKTNKVVIPEFRRLEAENFVKNGLEDFSISRVKSRMPWGIPVPGDETQVMYVWFDALTNYISTLDWPNGEKFNDFWQNGEVIQLAGKDQVRFQSLMWQAMLLSAGIKNTDTVFYHGFINANGQKMSKTIGNVVDPVAIAEEYGIDALRYYLARHINPFEDSDFTMEKFRNSYNDDLAHGIGNVVGRVMRLAESYSVKEKYNWPDKHEWLEKYNKEISEFISSFNFNRAMESILIFLQIIDKMIDERKPFLLIKNKETENEGREVISIALSYLEFAGRWLYPFMPSTSEIILLAIKENKKPENLFPRKD